MTSKITAIIITLAAALLTACGSPDSPAPSPTPPSEPAAVMSTPEPVDAESMRLTYEAVLNAVYFDHLLPDGQRLDWDEPYNDADNFYAVYDVDNDGCNELIIEYNSGPMVGKTEIIYTFDEETGWVYEELMQFPSLTYYNNGIIKADFSHNQGLAGRFWPYFLYKYNAPLDIYECVAMADAWDGSLHELNYDGRPFPSEIDRSGEGIVYYLLGTDDKTLGEPVDKSEYERWLSGFIGEAQELTLPKIPLEPESFAEGAAGTYELWLAQSGAERNYYSSVTSFSKGEVERFALEVRRSILERDWEALTACAAFPLSINGVETYRDADDLIADAPERLTGEDFTSALVSETCEEMFFNYESIKLADGRVHIAEIYAPGGGELRVIAINTHTRRAKQ